MLEKLFIHEPKIYFVIFLIAALIALLWYYCRIYLPYSKIASCRIEHRIAYWALTRQEFNCASFRILTKLAKKHESDGMYVVWIGLPILVVYGEEYVKQISNEPTAINKAWFYKLFEFFLGIGLLTSNGNTWKKQRKQVQPAFYNSTIKLHTPVINKNAEGLVKELSELQNHETDEIVEILSRHSLKIIYESSVSSEDVLNKEEVAFIIKKLKDVVEFLIYRVVTPWMYWDFFLPLFPYARKVNKCQKGLKQVLRPKLERIKEDMIAGQTALKETKMDSENFQRKPTTFSEILIQQHLQDPSFSMEQLTADIVFLVSAGFDTIIHSMKFCLMLLGEYQDVQAKAYEEIMSLNEGHVKYEDLQDLIYLDCVVKEALRLYSVPAFARNLESSLQLGKHVIPKDTTVLVFSYMLHRNPEIYPNPEKFVPERFMEENTKIRPWTHIPFSEGIRNCIGKGYAMIEMKIILIHVLRNFRIISRTNREDLELKWAIVLDCTQKIRLQFIPRRQVPDGKLQEL